MGEDCSANSFIKYSLGLIVHDENWPLYQKKDRPIYEIETWERTGIESARTLNCYIDKIWTTKLIASTFFYEIECTWPTKIYDYSFA